MNSSTTTTNSDMRRLEAENARLRDELAEARRRDADARRVLDHLPSTIGYWDRELRNRFGNHAYRSWFGIDPDQMHGKHIREVIGEERFRLNLPYIEGALRGETQVFERAIPTPDGKQVRYSLANYVPNIEAGAVQGFFVIVSDITAIKEAELALRESEERYRAVVDDQTEIICRIKRNGAYTFVNDLYCRFFGKKPAELVGRHWHPVAHPDDLAHIEAQLFTLSPANPVVIIENRVYSGSNRLHWMQFVNRGFFDAMGELVEIQSVGRDITDRKIAETALQAAHAELEQRLEQLRNLAIDTTLVEERERRAIAHDLHDGLGQLLHIAKLKLDALAKSTLALTDRKVLGELDNLIGDASRLIRSLTAQISPPVLADLGLIPALRWLAEEMQRTYSLEVSCKLACQPSQLNLSSAQAAIIFRLVRELLFNVARHAQVSCAQLDVRCDDDQLELTVSDAGIGMAQLEDALSSRLGQGLVSVRERIAFVGGHMSITSSPQNGTVVTLSMPLQAMPAIQGNRAP